MKLKSNANKTLIIGLIVCFCVLQASTIDFNSLPNYATQSVPDYITKDNTADNVITDEGATLGRVLFYDKQLSANNTTACANCHLQQYGFSDTATQSVGLNGELTGRHSMRLINARFGDEVKFFWGERASTLENQTTQPIQDHIEMGFSGTDGDPELADLIAKLNQIDYYNPLFHEAFGDTLITESGIQKALAQFIRSIQSFDSKYDVGRAQVEQNNQLFPNFSQQENDGLRLFNRAPNAGGAGCARCHAPPEFSIDPDSRNNGVITVAGNSQFTDLINTRAPTLRDMINPQGELNGPLMHDGSMKSLREVIDHYDSIPDGPNNNFDPRLNPQGERQVLNLTEGEKQALEAFLKTLTGSDVYTNQKWSNPFDVDGKLVIENSTVSVQSIPNPKLKYYPNPSNGLVFLAGRDQESEVFVFSLNGREIPFSLTQEQDGVMLSIEQKGVFIVKVVNAISGEVSFEKILIQ